MLMAWLLLIGGLFVLPLFLGVVVPEIKLLIGIILVLSIYSVVRQFFGDGIVTISLTLVGAYYLVYKHFWVTTTLWWMNIVLGTMAFSALGWTFIVVSKFFRGKRV